MNQLLKAAINEANRSLFKQKVGAVIFDKNKIVSVGHNTGQRSVKSLLKKFQRYPNSVHAEVAAILNAKRSVKGLDILVVRISTNNKLMLSMPCPQCLMYLKFVQLRRCWYSILCYTFSHFYRPAGRWMSTR